MFHFLRSLFLVAAANSAAGNFDYNCLMTKFSIIERINFNHLTFVQSLFTQFHLAMQETKQLVSFGTMGTKDHYRSQAEMLKSWKINPADYKAFFFTETSNGLHSRKKVLSSQNEINHLRYFFY